MQDYDIAGDIKLIKACLPEQLMRTTAFCTLDYPTLEKISNYVQVTTSNNETLIFDFNKKVPALAKYITNSQELCNAEKYVGPGFTATAVQQVETQN